MGYGPLDQGRFKCFPVQGDDHLLTVLRYVERPEKSVPFSLKAGDAAAILAALREAISQAEAEQGGSAEAT